MSAVQWYYARDNKQMGPVAAAELKRLAAAGELTADDLVWREGLAEWTPARNVRGLFDDEQKIAGEQVADQAAAESGRGGQLRQAAPPRKPSQPKRHPLDGMFDSLRGEPNIRFIETTVRLCRGGGLYGLPVAMLLAAVFASIAAGKGDLLGNLVSCAVLVLLLAGLHYTVGRSCEAMDRLSRSTDGKLPTTMLPDCLAALSLATGLAALFASVPAAVAASAYGMILLGIALFVVLVFMAIVFLNPAAVDMTIEPTDNSPSRQLLSATLLLAKAIVRTVPVVFGVGVFLGGLAMAYACYLALSDAERFHDAQIMAASARGLLVWSAALPLAAYLLFLLCMLWIDLCRAVLSLGSKTAESDGGETLSE